jgi:hypothetical protein
MAEKSITAGILENALSPQSVTTRDGAVTSVSIPDQIAADRYLASRQAATARLPGFRLFVVPGGDPA